MQTQKYPEIRVILIFYRMVFAAGTLLCLCATPRAGSITLPAQGPTPLAHPFASTPKPVHSPFSSSILTASDAVNPDRNILSGKLKNGLDALYGDRTARAIALRDEMPAGSLDRKILTWALGISDSRDIPGFQFLKALTELETWPGTTVIRRNFERALAAENNAPEDIIRFFASRKPLTADGMVILGTALVMKGQRARAHGIIAPWWHRARLDEREEQLVIDRMGSVLTLGDHQKRLQAMLYANRFTSAARIARHAGAASLYRGFTAVAGKNADALKKLNAVDARWKKQPIHTFARIRYLRRNGHYEDAAKLMLKAPNDAASLMDPDAWWVERRALSREMLDIGKAKLAYRLAAGYASASPATAVDAEFHAGWYALRFLKDPVTAQHHFSRIVALSSRPLSAARGFYWMARTAETLNEREKAQALFRRAARFGTTFYGQLAASRLGERKLDITYPRPTAEDRRRFETREPVQAIRHLQASGYGRKAGPLYRGLAEELKSPGEMALLAVLAERNNDHHTSLKIGKIAVQRGLYVGALSHPLGAIPPSAHISSTGKALAYAIARQESEFRHDAVSGANARGMLQLLPATAKGVASRRAMPYSLQKLSNDPAYNVTLGAHFLSEQLEKFDGSYILTFIGYNAGPRRASEWILRYGDPRGRPIDDVVDWIERIPYTETRNYVQRVMENYEVYKARLTGTMNIRNDLIAGRRTGG